MTRTEVNTKEKNKRNAVSDQQISRPFGTSVDNFYVTDFVSENSAIMAKASKVRIKNNLFKEKSIYN